MEENKEKGETQFTWVHRCSVSLVRICTIILDRKQRSQHKKILKRKICLFFILVAFSSDPHPSSAAPPSPVETYGDRSPSSLSSQPVKFHKANSPLLRSHRLYSWNTFIQMYIVSLKSFSHKMILFVYFYKHICISIFTLLYFLHPWVDFILNAFIHFELIYIYTFEFAYLYI